MTAQDSGRTCGDYWPLINDFVDGTIAPADRAELDRHLAACEACERAAADLGQMRRAAQSLPIRRPRADAWERIAAELRRELPAAPVATRARWTTRRVTLAAAAVLVAAVASTVWFVRQPGPASAPQAAAAATAPASASAPTSAGPVNPSHADVVRSIDEELKAAESHYEKAIAGLEQIARTEQNQLDPALAATLQKNIGVIDQAIRDSRSALQSQPANQLAQDSLFEALQRKVSLLEDTIGLINVMRKGDQAGTAKIIQGISKT
jgi:anti-sigma factor RsiW